MRVRGPRRSADTGPPVTCGCCGRDRPRTGVHELGSAPGVYVCWRCALWIAARIGRRREPAPWPRTCGEQQAAGRPCVTEVINDGSLDAVDELYAPELAQAARDWVAPFLAAFPDVRMEPSPSSGGRHSRGHFRFSSTHTAPWMGRPPTGPGGPRGALVHRAQRTHRRRVGLEDNDDRRRQVRAASPT